ncbi:hypothetical protein JQR85_13465 [Stutzerimonas urumqiensis]|uniref:hypothetical protein n=1 Tax=Stutzerimonas urumqiensis TaxID=638269 RepID=UPI000EB129EA|nr:hypothetical protein [Stutzerimonas urumqiensis]
MNRLALLAAAALLASPAAFAADENLCQLNMQELDDALATDVTIGTPVEGEVKELMKQAKQAQQSGNIEECIVHTTKALQLLELPGSSSDTAGAGSGAGS